MIPSDIQIKPLLHYCADSATAEWLREQIAMETEGEVSPAQIRADFTRGGFFLVAASGEPIGKVYSQHKHAALARQLLLAELS